MNKSREVFDATATAVGAIGFWAGEGDLSYSASRGHDDSVRCVAAESD